MEFAVRLQNHDELKNFKLKPGRHGSHGMLVAIHVSLKRASPSLHRDPFKEIFSYKNDDPSWDTFTHLLLIVTVAICH